MLSIVCFAAAVGVTPKVHGQQMSRVEREREETMLQNVSADVRKYYFDKNLHGLDWDALVQETKAKIDGASNVLVAHAEIQALMERLNDSHTNFYPPRNTNTVDYGWGFKVVGKRCLVTQVEPKSDAESKGMRPGDEVLAIDGFAVDRAGASKLKYAMYTLMPRSALVVDLREPNGKILHVTAAGIVHKHAPVTGLGDSTWALNQQRIDGENTWFELKAQYKELGPELMVLRVPQFIQTGVDVDNLMKKARNHKTLIVDLRGTPGGMVASVDSFFEDVFTHEVKIGNLVERDKVSPQTIKGNRKGAFTGDLIVLIDSETASAGEIFARVIQLQERGTILGDHSSGHTMESRVYPHWTDGDPSFLYGDGVTIADTVMSDGKSLEKIGVEPDRVFLPSPSDLQAGRDPLLSYAAGLAGVTLTPEDAAKLFVRELPKD